MVELKGSLSEHDEQCLFVQWMELQHPFVWFYAVPNGGYRPKRTAVKLKREGVKKGVPDIHIPDWRCWVEMKTECGGRLSQDQKDWKEHLEGNGDTVIVANGFTDAKVKIIEFLDSL